MDIDGDTLLGLIEKGGSELAAQLIQCWTLAENYQENKSVAQGETQTCK